MTRADARDHIRVPRDLFWLFAITNAFALSAGALVAVWLAQPIGDGQKADCQYSTAEHRGKSVETRLDFIRKCFGEEHTESSASADDDDALEKLSHERVENTPFPVAAEGDRSERTDDRNDKGEPGDIHVATLMPAVWESMS